jgi:hypothetical protein
MPSGDLLDALQVIGNVLDRKWRNAFIVDRVSHKALRCMVDGFA